MRTEDGTLIHKCLNGEPEIFGVVIDKYKAGIFALIYTKLKNFQDAEDVTQETFLEAFKNLRKLRNWDSFAVWLSSIAINISRKKIRSLSKQRDCEFIEDKDQNSMEKLAIKMYKDDQMLESLKEALNSLPEIYQQVLTLHYLGGMSGLEIARILGISHDNVRQRLSRAREQLKEEMIAMISQTFQQNKLSASFTFRVIEMVKRIKINPVSGARGLPLGVSLGVGLIFAILMLGQNIQVKMPDIMMGLPLPSDTKILKVGEIPIEAVKMSTIAYIGSKGNGRGLAPDPKGQENTFFMSPQAEGKWERKTDMPTARLSLAICSLNEKIYAIGGLDRNWNGLKTVEEFDPLKNEWVKKSDMPTGRAAFSASIIKGKIYAIGGCPGIWADSGRSLAVVKALEHLKPLLVGQDATVLSISGKTSFVAHSGVEVRFFSLQV